MGWKCALQVITDSGQLPLVRVGWNTVKTKLSALFLFPCSAMSNSKTSYGTLASTLVYGS